jgi:transcriptional regulator GlxA family with amidase domain
MPLEREGGQSQFIEHAPPEPESASLSRVLEWLQRHSHEGLSLTSIARRAGMSVRSLSRHFRKQTGMTPLEWLLRARVARAQLLLETTNQPIERIASGRGLRLRRFFARAVPPRRRHEPAELPPFLQGGSQGRRRSSPRLPRPVEVVPDPST